MVKKELKSYRRPTRLWLALVGAALLFSSLACNLTQRASPPPEATPIPVTTESVEELEENLKEAATQASTNGQVTLVFDEAQLTSLVAFELAKQPDQPFRDPQVYLRDGQIQLYGTAVQGGISLPVSIIATLTVNAQGEPEYEIVSATAGPLPLPQSILDQMAGRLDQVIGSQLDPENTHMIVESITIANGQMTVTGRARQ